MVEPTPPIVDVIVGLRQFAVHLGDLRGSHRRVRADCRQDIENLAVPRIPERIEKAGELAGIGVETRDVRWHD